MYTVGLPIGATVTHTYSATAYSTELRWVDGWTTRSIGVAAATASRKHAHSPTDISVFLANNPLVMIDPGLSLHAAHIMMADCTSLYRVRTTVE